MRRPEDLVAFWNAEIASADWFDHDKEHLVAVSLDTKLWVKAFNLVTVGILDQTLVHAREVFRPAVAVAAANLVLMHNHPSGDPAPSSDDIRSFKEMIAAGKLLGIPILDSIVVGQPKTGVGIRFTSLKEMGFSHEG